VGRLCLSQPCALLISGGSDGFEAAEHDAQEWLAEFDLIF
jgi:hypothetical protein